MEHMPRAEIFTKPQKRQSPEKSGLCRIKMAEAMGFELMDLLQSTVFKTVALNHSATPPFALRAP
ncbi:hypothetical protein EMIT0194MI4_10357 [Pseudomonas sp. IT-194MI4]